MAKDDDAKHTKMQKATYIPEKEMILFEGDQCKISVSMGPVDLSCHWKNFLDNITAGKKSELIFENSKGSASSVCPSLEDRVLEKFLYPCPQKFVSKR
jgi:hypothetical protein